MSSNWELLLLLVLACNMSGNAFPEAQSADIRPLRVESPPCAGGEEAESLVMPWLEDTAVLCTGRPLMADPHGM